MMTQCKLNIDNIRQLSEQLGVTYKLSGKVFYRKYAYNISLRNISMWQQRDSENKYKIKREYFKLVAKQSKITKLMDRLGIDYRFRREQNFNLYLSDDTIVRRILNTMSEDVLTIDGPKNEQHLNVLHSNRKAIVKHQLYYRKYRFKIAYNTNTQFKEAILPVLKQYLRDTPPENIKVSSNYYRLIRDMETAQTMKQNAPNGTNYKNLASWNYRSRINSWHTISVYFADEEDYIMFKMMVGGDTLHEYEVVLQEDL